MYNHSSCRYDLTYTYVIHKIDTIRKILVGDSRVITLKIYLHVVFL